MFKVLSNCKNEGIFGEKKHEIAEKYCFCQFILHNSIISNTFVFEIGEHFSQCKVVISGHNTSFSSFIAIIVLVERWFNWYVDIVV